MTTPTPEADARLRHVLGALPALLRPDRPPAAHLPEIARLVAETFDARYAAASLVEDGRPTPVAFSGLSAQEVSDLGDPPSGEGLLGALLRSGGTLRVGLDEATHTEPLDLSPAHPPSRPFLGACLTSPSGTVGLVWMAAPRSGAGFTEQDESLLALLAGALGESIASARLLRDALEARRWMRAATQMTGDLFGGDTEHCLRLLAERSVELADADFVAVVTVADDLLTFRYTYGPEGRPMTGRSVPLSESPIMTQVLNTGRPVRLPRMRQATSAVLRLLVGQDVGPAMVIPLPGGKSVMGGLFLARETSAPAFTDTDVEIAESFAAHAALTLEISSARVMAERLRLVEDRNRIARDLHDHVVQRLFATGLSLQRAMNGVEGELRAPLEAGVVSLDESIRQIRNTIHVLTNARDEGLTLETHLGRVVREMTPLLGFPPVLLLEPPSGEVSGPLAADLGVCVREGLSNVVKHARAGTVEIRAAVEPPYLLLTLSDDGVGIHSSRRSGLANLARRAEQYGGSMEVESNEDEGTRLTWRVPVPIR